MPSDPGRAYCGVVAKRDTSSYVPNRGVWLLPTRAKPRAKALVAHPDPSVRDFAVETLKEIEIFERSEGSYGYVFYLLQRA